MKIRNIAIIAHVDHGKTTLVDAMFQQAGTFRANQTVRERAMDSMDLERERGITILAKCTSVKWEDIRINIVDTPGHADFGGEVERILRMVDGAILLVDAAEGPMPQTKFVTGKALEMGLKPIVVVNKVDRHDARASEVVDEIFDLFADLGATESQLDFPYLFAVGREGWASPNWDAKSADLRPLFQLVIEHVPSPSVIIDKPFSMLITMLDYDPYLGRVLTGRVDTGHLQQNETIHAVNYQGNPIETTRVTKLLAFRGLERVPIERAEAGDIVAIAGFETATVANTLGASAVQIPIPAPPIAPPTLAMTFSINDSPLSGRDGNKVTSRMIRERLLREAEGNVAIKISKTANENAFQVAGRGELQLGVLIETMRREGYELTIGKPRVLFRNDQTTNEKLEPLEDVLIDVDEEFAGVVVEKMSKRRAELTDMRSAAGGKTRLAFSAPSRGLIGYHGDFLTDTRGTGIMNRTFKCFGPYRGKISGRRHGVMISTDSGTAVPFALWNLEDRGAIFIKAGAQVYTGMIIGENTRSGDLEVNPMKTKQLTNIRAASKDEAVRLTPAKVMSLEKAITYIDDDEVVEVTPQHIRLRKATLDPNKRKRERRAAMAEES